MKEKMTLSALATGAVAMGFLLGARQKMLKVMLSVVGACSLICCWTPVVLAAPYIISQTQLFSLSDTKIVNEADMNGEREYITQEIDEINVAFFGAPSSILLAGNTWDFVGVNYELSSTLDYAYEAYCRDGSFFSDCYTKGVYQVSSEVGMDGVILPGQDQQLYTHFPVVLEAEAQSAFPFFEPPSDRKQIESPTIPIQQSISLLTSDHDLSFLDVEEFTFQLIEVVKWGIADRDAGDDENDSIAQYLWEGTIKIDYEYQPAVIPIPSAFWLFGSGILGLMGIAKRKIS